MADEQGRWFKVFASITESDVFGDAQALRCWIWCLKSANWKPQMCKRQMFPRGTFWCNIREAAAECRCAVKTWDQAIEHLVKLGMVSVVRSPKCITITVTNYDRFQSGIVVATTTNGSTNGSTNGDTNSSTVTTTRSRSPRPMKTEVENNASALPPQDGCSTDKPAKPKRVVFDPLAVDLPPAFQTDLGRKAWAAWATHRKEIGKKLTGESVKQQLKQLHEAGLEDGVAMIRASIMNGWQGLFPLAKKPARNEHVNTKPMRPIYGDNQ